MPNISSPSIQVRGARQHNLKCIDVDIPRGQLVVVTGPSGSGKSSLAVDTVFAEGQRQYIETLSVYARQFLNQIPKPDVDSVEGLQPTLCIDQHRAPSNRRSTVGTVTEVYDYLRVIMARVANVRCHQCGDVIRQQSESQIVERITSLPESTKVMLLAPLVRGKKGSHDGAFEQIRKAGLVRVRVDGEVVDLEQRPILDQKKSHSIEAVVDRIVIRANIEDRLFESLGLALKLGDGSAIASHQSGDQETGEATWIDHDFNSKLGCPNCNTSYLEIEPRTFSFNSPYGACKSCDGLGVKEQFDWNKVLDPSQPIIESIIPWKKLTASARKSRIDLLLPILQATGIDPMATVDSLNPKQMQRLLTGQRPLEPEKQGDTQGGLAILLEKELVTTTAEKRLAFLESFRDQIECVTCQGSRLGAHANAALLADKTITQIANLPIEQALAFFETIELDPMQREIGQVALDEVTHRLRYLNHVGVGYLSLDRSADSLSGGEYQRVRLATSIGSGLAGVCYVLDEPTIGLHPRDNRQMIDSIRGLLNNGNSVLVVEHDENVMRASDWMIEFGPEAGTLGGEIVAEGTVSTIIDHPSSVTGAFLSGRRRIHIERAEELKSSTTSNDHDAKAHASQLKFSQANIHNIKNLDLAIPMGKLIAITGVSGSGKSSLVDFVIAPNLKTFAQTGMSSAPECCSAFDVPENVTGLVTVDQSPLGRNSRSNPATYCGVFSEIRKIFAATQLAKQRGYSSTRFSFNSVEGRCGTCKGHGERKLDMKFLPELMVPCETCRGHRYNQQTLQVRYRDRSIADVLELSVVSARDFFENFAKIVRILDQLIAVGLGYLNLGQSATKLSGGEAQRIKLATELARGVEFGHTIYLLDEPTTGLHFVDVERLLLMLIRLVEKGNSVIVVEHNLEIIRHADWIIDLGPEGGANGGSIVAEGTPDSVAQCNESHTGKFLKSTHEANLS